MRARRVPPHGICRPSRNCRAGMVMKIVLFASVKIERLTATELAYVDERGEKHTIDFGVCRANVIASEGDSQFRYVGFGIPAGHHHISCS